MEKVTAVTSLTCVWVVVDHTMPTPPHNNSHYRIKASSFVKNISSKRFSA